MTASELMEKLKTCLPDAPILVIEGNNVTRIASVAEPKSEKAVVLIAEPVKTPVGKVSHLLSEALAQGVSKVFEVETSESVLHPGKFQVDIDGTPFSNEFDTQGEAKAYLSGFTMGFSVGGGMKGVAE